MMLASRDDSQKVGPENEDTKEHSGTASVEAMNTTTTTSATPPTDAANQSAKEVKGNNKNNDRDIIPTQGGGGGNSGGGGGGGGVSEKRKYHPTREPESPPVMGIITKPQLSDFSPEPKRERITTMNPSNDHDNTYFSLDDSPASYPKHVIVPTSEQPPMGERYSSTMSGLYDIPLDDHIPHSSSHRLPQPRSSHQQHHHQQQQPPPPHHLHHQHHSQQQSQQQHHQHNTKSAPHDSFSPPDNKNLGYGSHSHHHLHSSHHSHSAQLLTPDSIGRDRHPSHSYDSHHQPYNTNSSSRDGSGYHESSSYHDVYRTASYTPEMDYGGGSGGNRYGTTTVHPGHGPPPPPPSTENMNRPRRWACDYCNVATFLSYEEACAHEEQCPTRHGFNTEPTPYPPPPPPPHHSSHNRHLPSSSTRALQPPPPVMPTPSGLYSRSANDSSMVVHTHGPPPLPGSGLGALYHPGQEVVTPPTPHRHPQPNSSSSGGSSGNRWNTSGSHTSTPHGPPLPVFPHEPNYYHHHHNHRPSGNNDYYDTGRDEPNLYPGPSHHGSSIGGGGGGGSGSAYPPQQQSLYPPSYHQGQGSASSPSSYPPPQPSHHHSPHETYYGGGPPPSHHSGTASGGGGGVMTLSGPSSSSFRSGQRHRLVLAMPTDRDSLSDRQCYVRNEMVEIFAATDKDVSARHSKGAQKLVLGQVGIRCVHCRHLRPRDRAERAVCYPSSISRIYQTVADMQRFHFEQCREIPDHVRQLYKKLKTTRPRGVGSPQTYWISSARAMGLEDTGDGIRFANDDNTNTTRKSNNHHVLVGGGTSNSSHNDRSTDTSIEGDML